MKYAVMAMACLVVLLGIAVIFGWYLHSVLLVQLLPVFAPMQYNAALAFVLCGSGLLFLVCQRPRITLLCAGLSAGLSLLTLVEYIAGLNIGIDRFFIEPMVTAKVTDPGRMASTTAVAHLLYSIGLVLASGKRPIIRRDIAAGLIGAITTAIGAAILFGYLVGKDTPYAWSHPTYMAVHTAVGLVILGMGMFVLAIRAGLINERRLDWLPIATGIGIATIALALWQGLLTQQRLHIKQVMSNQSGHIKSSIETVVNTQILALLRLGKRWEQQGGTPWRLWKADTALYLEHQPGLQAISWVDPLLHVRWIEPLAGNEAAQDLYLGFESRLKEALDRARTQRSIVLTRSIGLVQGGQAIIAYVPLFIKSIKSSKNRFDGFIGGIFRIDALFNEIINEAIHKETRKDYHIDLFEDQQKIYSYHPVAPPIESRWVHEQAIDLYNLNWSMRIWPSRTLEKKLSTAMPEISLVAGLVLAFLAMHIVRLTQVAGQKETMLRRLNQALEDEIIERKQAGKELREHRQHLEELVEVRAGELKESNSQLQQLANHLQIVREDERARIARDVHDELGQVLTVLNIDVHWISKRVSEGQPELAAKVRTMSSVITAAIGSVQRITSELRPAVLDELGLGAAVHWCMEEFEKRTGVNSRFSVELNGVKLDSDRAMAVFRILQEALTNVTRHSHATQVITDLSIENNTLTMAVEDNGTGIDAKNIVAKNSFGLMGMRERALAFGGEVTIKGSAGEGTTILLRLPVNGIRGPSQTHMA